MFSYAYDKGLPEILENRRIFLEAKRKGDGDIIDLLMLRASVYEGSPPLTKEEKLAIVKKTPNHVFDLLAALKIIPEWAAFSWQLNALDNEWVGP